MCFVTVTWRSRSSHPSTLTAPLGGNAYRKTEEGNRHYVDGLYEEALRAYTEAQVDLPEAPQLFYDIGNVLYL